MRTAIVANSASEPILLEEFKDTLRLDGAEEDASLGAYISTARALVEEYSNLVLIDRTLNLFLDKWSLDSGGSTEPWWNGVSDGAISIFADCPSIAKLPVRPVSQITSINMVAADGTETLWDAENYHLRPGLNSAIALRSGRRWPVPGKPVDGIKITLTAGFGAGWNDVPASVRQALLMLASYLYANRGDQGPGDAVKASGAMTLLRPYRERRL